MICINSFGINKFKFFRGYVSLMHLLATWVCIATQLTLQNIAMKCYFNKFNEPKNRAPLAESGKIIFKSGVRAQFNIR